MDEKKERSIHNLIDDAVEILRNSKSFYKIIIKGKISNIIIEKPKEDGKEE